MIAETKKHFKAEIQDTKINYANLPDDALEKYVGKGTPFHDVYYAPTDLVTLQSTQTLKVQGKYSLRKEADEHLLQLSVAFYEYFHQPIVVMSAYRSYNYQKNQIAESCKTSGYCAIEGESEHQL
jgi:LAS superfamily LD-carboxypeptidase LdcB